MRLLVKLRFKRAVALERIEALDGASPVGIVHSDTLFSALANQWVKVPAPVPLKELIARLGSDAPPFLVSSAFPYAGTDFYLPTPRGTGEIYRELLKDVTYLEAEDFLKLAQGKQAHLPRVADSAAAVPFPVGFTAPGVSLDRVTSGSNVYDRSGWSMPAGCGLYFLVELHDRTLRGTIELCIRLLGEAGIGGDRSIGCGAFDADIDEVETDSVWTELFAREAAPDVSYCSLALCCPRRGGGDGSEAGAAASYRLLTRAGWISSSSSFVQAKRAECRMFAEGSLFRSPVKGCIADVTPRAFLSEHRVYRYGLAMMAAGVW